MATYYVRTDGSNSNAGTGPGTGQAWQTITKAMAAGGAASGDTVYIRPGNYIEQIQTPQSFGSETFFIGDVTGRHFGATEGVAGRVLLNGFLSGQASAPTALNLININNASNITLQHITFLRGSARAVSFAGTSQNCKILDCVFLFAGAAAATSSAVLVAGVAGTAMNHTIERCVFMGNTSAGIQIQITAYSSASDTDYNVMIRCCIFHNTGGPWFTGSGSGSGKAYGYRIVHCHLYGGITGVSNMRSSEVSLEVENCVMFTGNTTALNAFASGQFLEDNNYLHAATPRINVSAGLGSITAYAPLFEYPTERLGQARLLQHSMGPDRLAEWPATAGQSNYQPSTDINGFPFGGGRQIGPYMPQLFTVSTTTVRNGTFALEAGTRGAGEWSYHDMLVPVDAVSTTFSVYVQINSSYTFTGSNEKPRLRILDHSCGTAGGSDLMTGGHSSWNQLSVTLTPQRKGYVIARFEHKNGAAGGRSFWDDWSVT